MIEQDRSTFTYYVLDLYRWSELLTQSDFIGLIRNVITHINTFSNKLIVPCDAAFIDRHTLDYHFEAIIADHDELPNSLFIYSQKPSNKICLTIALVVHDISTAVRLRMELPDIVPQSVGWYEKCQRKYAAHYIAYMGDEAVPD